MSTLKFYSFLIFLICLPLALSGCGQAEADNELAENSFPPEVAVMTAQAVERPVNRAYPGRLVPFRQAEVRARAAGILTKRLYTEGQDLQEGALLFQIDDAQLKLDVLTAQSELDRCEAELFKNQDTLKRHQVLYDKKVMQEHDFVATQTAEKQARAALANASAALERAKLLLSYTQVSAPISGRAGLAMVSEGALVGQNEATQLTTIEQIDPIYVDFSQAAVDAESINEGLTQGSLKKPDDSVVEVQLKLPDGSFYGQAGQIIFTDSSVDPETDKVAMRALFPNPDKRLRPGTYLTVYLSSAINPNVFLVPRDSLIRNAEGSYLMLVNEQGLVEKRSVQADELEAKNWVVTAGLSANDQIILNAMAGSALEGQQVTASVINEAPQLANN